MRNAYLLTLLAIPLANLAACIFDGASRQTHARVAPATAAFALRCVESGSPGARVVAVYAKDSDVTSDVRALKAWGRVASDAACTLVPTVLPVPARFDD